MITSCGFNMAFTQGLNTPLLAPIFRAWRNGNGRSYPVRGIGVRLIDCPWRILACRHLGVHHGILAIRGKSTRDILEGYAAAATPAFIAAYDRLSPESIYEHVIDLLPGRRAKVADIGAGTGRDAAWFACQGHYVFAAEPVREFREAGRALHCSENIT
jgi:hypothetical protein